MMRRLLLLALVAQACQPPPGASAAADACEPCVAADACCVAHTANPQSNCQLLATCLSLTAEGRVEAASGCAYYVRVASTPPAPAACGPHPDAD